MSYRELIRINGSFSISEIVEMRTKNKDATRSTGAAVSSFITDFQFVAVGPGTSSAGSQLLNMKSTMVKGDRLTQADAKNFSSPSLEQELAGVGSWHTMGINSRVC